MTQKPKPIALSRRERQIMDILYKLERASVGQVAGPPFAISSKRFLMVRPKKLWPRSSAAKSRAFPPKNSIVLPVSLQKDERRANQYDDEYARRL
jgi:hypothetical protein